MTTVNFTESLAASALASNVPYPKIAQTMAIELPVLTNYLAGSALLPASQLPRFCQAINSIEPFNHLLTPFNCRVISLDTVQAKVQSLRLNIKQLEQRHAQLIEEARA